MIAARSSSPGRVAVDGPEDHRDLPGDFGHRAAIEVRFADTDAMGHVNDAVYLTFVETARVRWWSAVTGEPIQREPGRAEGMILAEAEVAFRSPVFFGETVVVESRATRLGRTSLSRWSIGSRLRGQTVRFVSWQPAGALSFATTTSPSRRRRGAPPWRTMWRRSKGGRSAEPALENSEQRLGSQLVANDARAGSVTTTTIPDRVFDPDRPCPEERERPGCSAPDAERKHLPVGSSARPADSLCQASQTAAPPVQPLDRFCGECGGPVVGDSTEFSGAAVPPSTSAPSAERRLVAVLFADLVGFTTLAEGRDPEEVRELLTRYFDTARDVIGLYGGVVEKFTGDAVMAVWGSPIAREDDPERAVRAALDLVDRVSALAGTGRTASAPGGRHER